MASHSKFIEANNNNTTSNDVESDSSKIVKGNLDPKPAGIDGGVFILGATFIMVGLMDCLQSLVKNLQPGKATAFDIVPAISWVIAFTATFICILQMIYHLRCRYLYLVFITMYIYCMFEWGAAMSQFL